MRPISTKILAAVSAAVGAALLAPSLTLAQSASSANSGALEEVVVTAEKVSDTAQKTAMSIEVVKGAEIDQEGFNDINNVLKDVPAVVVRNSAGGPVIDIRGVSSGALPNNDSDPAVGVNTDGVYTSVAGAPGQLSFFDVDHVEVLRGPQGTLYGASAEAGVINILTNNPTNKFDAAGTLEAGNYNLQRVSGMVNVPLDELLSLRVAFNSINRRGYYTSGGDDQVAQTARVKLLFKPSDDLSLLLGSEYSKEGGHGNIGGRNAGVPAWGLGSPPGNPLDDISKDDGISGTLPWYGQENKNLRTWAQFDWTTPAGTLTVLPSHIYNPTSNFATNRAWLCPGLSDKPPAPCMGPSGPGGGWVQESDQNGAPVYDVVTNTGNTTQSAAEVRFASLPSSPVKWVVGGYYSYIRQQSTGDTFGLSTLLYWENNKAGFAQATFPVSNSFRVVAGVRDGTDERAFYNTSPPLTGIPGTPSSAARSFDHFDWKAGLEQDLSPSSLLYLTVATGYRPGSIETGGGATVAGPGGTTIPNPNEFTKPEELTSYELGSKNQFFDNTLRVNADVYFYNYVNRQYTSFFFTTNPTCPNGQVANGPCLIENNANKSTNTGAEIQAQWAFTANDQLGGTIAYLDAKATATQNVYINSANGQPALANIDSATMPNAPKWQMMAQYQHTFTMPDGSRLTPHITGRYTTVSYIEGFNYLAGGALGNLYTQQGYTAYDANVLYTAASGKWTLNGYVQNAGNVYVKTDTDGQYTQIAAPRTYGAVFSMHL